MRRLLAITKALSDLNRVRIICALKSRGELCVCQIQELLDLAPSTTSKHLNILASAGLIDSRKEGRWVHYRLTDDGEVPCCGEELTEWIYRQATGQKQIKADEVRLSQLLCYTKEELCQLQTEGSECCPSAPATPAGVKLPKPGRGSSKRT